MKTAYLVASLALVGCVAGEEVSSVSSAVESENKLGLNKLGLNKLGLNKLGLNKLGLNGLAPIAGETALVDSADGREVLTYVVSCALAEGTSVSVTATDGTAYTFAGSLGLAPAWATGTPTVAERRWVSSCLLARTNYFGVAVEISIRGNTPALALAPGEAEEFDFSEGRFYGDLFAPEGTTMYACSNVAASDLEAGGSAELRWCTWSDDGVTTRCNFEYTGPCRTACVGDDCTAPDGTYSQPVSIYLR